jgi:hypothetical protein
MSIPDSQINEAIRARMSERIDRLQEISQQVEAQNTQLEQQLSLDMQAHAKAARNGELGTDWQLVQQRIDMHQTSFEDVFSGEDDSPQAQRIRQQSQNGISRMREEIKSEDQENPDDVTVDRFAEISELQSHMKARAEEIRALIESRGLGNV